MNPQQYCADLVSRSHSSFRLSFLLLNHERRQAINALYAFCREVDDIVDEAQDAAGARSQLETWRNEIDLLYEDHPTHIISCALQPAIKAYQLSKSHFIAIIDGMEMDLDQNRYANFDELYLYCYRAAGVVGLLAAQIFGYTDPKTEKYAEALGIALQLTNILRDVGEDLTRDRIYIPEDELARFGLTETTLTAPEQHAQLIELLEFQQNRAESYYHKALSSLPDADSKSQLSGLVMGAIYHALLKQITLESYPVLNKKVRLSKFKKVVATIRFLISRRYD
ncbi:MAG: presqualene diphosphate synthase HpnD [Gammaproteobacteria bacterium]|nr:presqualene diphosphate synthase HpnD [Gammaproteobacteria bacterium]